MKIFIYTFLALMFCNVSFAEKIDSLFGIKLGGVIDKSIIIERINRVPLDFIGHYNNHKEDYKYPKNFDLSVFHIYKVEPPKKNSMFNNYFVKVYPLSERVYDIYAYRNTWDPKYGSKEICCFGNKEYKEKEVCKNGGCFFKNPKTQEYRDKIIKESSDLFDALINYYSKKTGSDFWQGIHEIPLTVVDGYIYKELKNSILYIAKPEGSYGWAYKDDSYRGEVYELGISIRAKKINTKEFIKAGAVKVGEKKKETEKSYEQILDKTGL
jgi:hypothetical protein